MTRQEAMERISNIRKEKANSISAETDELDETEGIFKDIDALDMALAFLSTSYCNWISVNYFLPKDDKPVLIYAHGEIQIGKYNKSSTQKWDYYSSNMLWEYPIVTHWMPLPEPPKGE